MAIVHWLVRVVLVVWLFRIVWNLVRAMLEEFK